MGHADRQSAPAIRPAIEMSSSNSGQCKLLPPPPISYRVRCSGAALFKTGNHTSGTLNTRPSASATRMETVIGGETYWAEPELGFVATRFDMNVRRLFALIAEKEKPVHGFSVKWPDAAASQPCCPA